MKPKNTTSKLIQFNALHLALIEFVKAGEPARYTRTEIVKRAVMQYVTSHPSWDAEAFQEFWENDRAMEGVSASERERMEEELRDFERSRQVQTPLFDSRGMEFDL